MLSLKNTTAQQTLARLSTLWCWSVASEVMTTKIRNKQFANNISIKVLGSEYKDACLVFN